jgi:hypothetical protein
MSSRKEQKEALRAERERKAQEAAAGERRKRMVGYGVGGVLVAAVVAALAVLVLAGGGGGSSGDNSRAAEPAAQDFTPVSIPPARGATLEDAAKAAGCKVQTFPDEGQNHVNGHVEYKTNPPTSGNHFEIPAPDGAYTKAPPMEQLVHSLEHGRVNIWYQPNASARLKGQLKSLFDEDNYHVLLTPNTRNMQAEVAASVWTRSITCPKVNDRTWDALRLFRDRYRDQAPEQVP